MASGPINSVVFITPHRDDYETLCARYDVVHNPISVPIDPDFSLVEIGVYEKDFPETMKAFSVAYPKSIRNVQGRQAAKLFAKVRFGTHYRQDVTREDLPTALHYALETSEGNFSAIEEKDLAVWQQLESLFLHLHKKLDALNVTGLASLVVDTQSLTVAVHVQ